MDSVMTYVHQQGSVALSCDGDDSEGPTPVALAEINAAGRKFPSLTQVQMQGALRHCLGGSGPDSSPLTALPMWPSSTSCSDGSISSTAGDDSDGVIGDGALFEGSQDLDDWIEGNLANEGVRASHIVRLGGTAVPFEYKGDETMQSIGDAFSKNVKYFGE